MTDYVAPKELIQEAVQLAKRKCDLSTRDMLIRGILAGAFLGYATSLAIVVTSQGLPPIIGAILFPVGFVMLALLGFELVTGNFALLPAGVMAGTVGITKLLRNWSWVYVGNMIGSVLYAALFYLAITNWRTGNGGAVADLLKQAAQKKFVIVDAGMNDLIRPALYQSYHEIVPVREPAGPARARVDVVGHAPNP